MLVFKERKFIKSPFSSEAELENVVISNYEHLFGPNSIYLPKAKIKTADGVGTIPDGFAIDIVQKQWYLVEAELIHHSVWNHIAPQVTKQLLASQQSVTRRILTDLTVELYRTDPYTKEKFEDAGIPEIDVRRHIDDILLLDPIVGVPIDGITNDLRDWARTLRYKVKLWTISKFVEFNNTGNIVYDLPEEFKPELDTEQESKDENQEKQIMQYDVTLADLYSSGLLQANQVLTMTYKPRNGIQRTFEATVLDDGSLITQGQTFSAPSYAALAGIQAAGSDRKTVNGWTAWKTNEGKTLAELREEYLKTT